MRRFKNLASRVVSSLGGRPLRKRKQRRSRPLGGERLEDRLLLSAVYGDFNGDGHGDIAVGSPRENIGSDVDAGGVNVIYGSASGLTATGDQFFSQDTANVPGTSDANDLFGNALAVGDFDGDGYDDLAIGIPGEEVNGADRAGAVQVFFGTSNGLSTTGNEYWTQNTAGVLGIVESGDFFGRTLAAGDFNGDGKDDLAIGAPAEDLYSQDAGGVVQILHGTTKGLSASQDQYWHQNSTGVLDSVESGDGYGSALATGDFDGDGYDDLAIGIEYETINGHVNAGAVNILFGSNASLTSQGNQFLHQDITNIQGTTGDDDRYGKTLAVGDFNQDGRDDLAIGIPFEDVGSAQRAGAVNVLYGFGLGLETASSQYFTQNTWGVEGVAETDDWFGLSLAAGDFNGDGYDDLAIGVMGEDIGSISNAGAVNVLYSRLHKSPNGPYAKLSSAGDEILHQNVAGVAGTAQTNDYYGSSLFAGDTNGDGIADLGIGISGETVNGHKFAGSLDIVFGEIGYYGLDPFGHQSINQDTPGIYGVAEGSDYFGGPPV